MSAIGDLLSLWGSRSRRKSAVPTAAPITPPFSSGALDGPAWEQRAAALIAGHGSCVHLEEPEIQALPAMILGRSVGTVLWRAGRWRRGLDQTALVAERIEDLAHTTAWLDHHGSALIALGLTRAGH